MASSSNNGTHYPPKEDIGNQFREGESWNGIGKRCREMNERIGEARCDVKAPVIFLVSQSLGTPFPGDGRREPLLRLQHAGTPDCDVTAWL